MSKLGKFDTKTPTIVKESAPDKVVNFMGGTSYKLTPLNTLKIIAASAIFGEPQYYKGGIVAKASVFNYTSSIDAHRIPFVKGRENTADVFTKAIDAALDYDFGATLDFAVELRNDYLMRLNPAVIFIRASIHPNRENFNNENPGKMRTVGKLIAHRPDDLTNQFEYYAYIKGGKNKLSSLVKRTWADRLSEFSRYQLNKYKGKKLIDLVRISHATSADINELMKTGTIEITETENTWEILKSKGKTWREILETIDIPHMALLRNLRGIFTEIKDVDDVKVVIEVLKKGVVNGKQFPFRYYSAYNAIKVDATVNHKALLMDALEECIDIACASFPKLKGKTMCISDNSGSAWGAFNSEYGTVTVAEISNLSSLITCSQAEEGEIGIIGDRLEIVPVSKRNGILSQLTQLNKFRESIGGSTENGIWLFFDKAINEHIHYDNIFIYSDQQAGSGGLYGRNPSADSKYLFGGRGQSIDVLALVLKYRQTVNPKVNVFSVQVAGYDNMVFPENLYRGALLSGWTGRETQYSAALIKTWDEIEGLATPKKTTPVKSGKAKVKNDIAPAVKIPMFNKK